MMSYHLNVELQCAPGNNVGCILFRRRFNAKGPLRGRIALSRHECKIDALERRWPLRMGGTWAKEGFLGGPWQIESSVTAVWMPAKPPICFRIAEESKSGPVDRPI